MAGYCTTALEVEHVLVLSSDVYCVYSRAQLLIRKQKSYRI